MKFKTVIIEDEPLAQQELLRLLKKVAPDIFVVITIENVEDGIAYFTAKPDVDLIFSDIQLADGLCFEIFKSVEILTPIIFLTAFNEFAIKSFEQNSIDYLLKPVEEHKLVSAIQKFKTLRIPTPTESKGQTNNLNEVAKQFLNLVNQSHVSYKSRFLLRIGDQIKFADVNQIAGFFAEDNVVFVQLFSGKKYILDYTISQLVEQLNPAEFFRINRGYIINVKAIAEIHKHFNSRLNVKILPTNDSQIVSRERVQEFLNWIER